jgi:hypothetical protein
MARPTKDEPVRTCARCGKQGRFARETECGTCAAKRKDWLSPRAKERAAKYRSKPEVAERIRAKANERYQQIKADPERYAHLNNLRRKLERKYKGHANPTGETRSGACEICLQHADCLRLDHDHSTGAARGWLCNKCNLALGAFNDSPKLLAAAINYLQTRIRLAS